MTITIIGLQGDRFATCSESMAHKLEATFQVTATTDPDVRRFLSADERHAARQAAIRRATGLAHPHDHATDDDFVPGGEFDQFVNECGPEVFT